MKKKKKKSQFFQINAVTSSPSSVVKIRKTEIHIVLIQPDQSFQ